MIKNSFLYYTFAWFPFLDELSRVEQLTILNNPLKLSLTGLHQQIMDKKPDHIFGFAKTKGKFSFCETVALNMFHRNPIMKHANNLSLSADLILPKGFIRRKTGTSSFCNWTIYKTQLFLNDNQLEQIKLSFFHIANKIHLNDIIMMLHKEKGTEIQQKRA